MQRSNTAGRKSKAKPTHADDTAPSADSDDIGTLKGRIARLEADNKRLREQVAALTGETTRVPRSGAGDSVREQQHNFFKYSNSRRY
jgi:hypothetical protein